MTAVTEFMRDGRHVLAAQLSALILVVVNAILNILSYESVSSVRVKFVLEG